MWVNLGWFCLLGFGDFGVLISTFWVLVLKFWFLFAFLFECSWMYMYRCVYILGGFRFDLWFGFEFWVVSVCDFWFSNWIRVFGNV